MARSYRRWAAFVCTACLLTCTAALAADPEHSFAGIRVLIQKQYPRVPFISADALAKALAQDRSPLRLFDTRSADEFAVSHLQGAVRLDPDHPDLSPWLKDKKRQVVTYCSVGYRSAAVGKALLDAGFADVHNLEGGIFAWANAGRPVYRDGARVRKVHPYDALWGRLLDAALRSELPR